MQLALALVLLIGSGLLMSSFVRLAGRDLNFVPDRPRPARLQRAVRLDMRSRSASYRGFPYFQIDPPPSRSHLSACWIGCARVPGAESVAGISAPPVDSFVLATVEVQLADATPADAGPQSAAYFVVTPNLFATIRHADRARARFHRSRRREHALVRDRQRDRGAPVLAGRGSDRQATDARHRARRAARVRSSASFATSRRGMRTIRRPWCTRRFCSSRHVIARRGPDLLGSMTFMLRAAGDPAAIVPAARLAVAEIEPDRPLAEVSTVVTHMSRATAKFRDFVLLVGVFAAAAMLLAAVGTYGVMVFTVSQRTREIGIRRALGAGTGEIVELVGRRALVLVAIGLAGGLAGALALTRLIASQLWGVTPTDPATFAAVSLILAGIAVVACIGPVRRGDGRGSDDCAPNRLMTASSARPASSTRR